MAPAGTRPPVRRFGLDRPAANCVNALVSGRDSGDGFRGFRPAGWVRAAALVGRLAERTTGRPLGALDEDEVRARVAKRLGRAVEGDDPGLRALLADAAEAPLTSLGRVWLRGELVRRGVTDGLLEDELRRRPQIAATPVPMPLVVAGLPRTGTTLLHTLLGLDSEAVAFRFWELRRPYPLASGRVDRARRLLLAAAMAALANSMAPALRDIHRVAALAPEEDVFLFRDIGMLATPVAAPRYLDWLLASDPLPGYLTYRRHLQALLHDRPGRRPVLKSPFHLGRLDALLASLPEAVVVQTHRDPAVALASWCSLSAVLGSASSSRVEPEALGRRWLDYWCAELDRALEARSALGDGGFHDVVYEALVADPISEVERLYDRIGLELSPLARRRMAAWIGRHHRGRAGTHRYALADFGLDAGEVERRFARYRAWLASMTPS